MKTIVLTGLAIAACVFALEANAAACSIVPPANASNTLLATLAKVSRVDAERVALKAVKTSHKKTVKSAELEAEGGCLIWSFDIGVAGSRMTHEVAVDAGNAAVLSVNTESPAQEADEARADSTGHASH